MSGCRAADSRKPTRQRKPTVAQLRGAAIHRFEEHTIRPNCLDAIRQAVDVAPGLATRAGVPRIVIDENPHAPLVTGAADAAQGRESAGQVAVRVELVAIVDGDPGIGRPEEHGDDPQLDGTLRHGRFLDTRSGVRNSGRHEPA